VPSVFFFALLGPLGAARGRPSVLDKTSAKENPGEPGAWFRHAPDPPSPVEKERLLFLSAEAELFSRNIVPLLRFFLMHFTAITLVKLYLESNPGSVRQMQL
jgi:hypothetical protein